MNRYVIAVGAMAAGVLAAGCGSTETSGTPAPEGTTAAAPLWDPCEISDDTVQALGMETDSKETGIGGIEQPGWKICSWDGPQYGLAVQSTSNGVDYFKNKPENTDFRPVTIAGRSGEQFRVDGTTRDAKCDVVFSAEQGVVQITVLGWPGDDGPDDPCAELEKVTEILVPVIPA